MLQSLIFNSKNYFLEEYFQLYIYKYIYIYIERERLTPCKAEQTLGYKKKKHKRIKAYRKSV